MAWKGALRGLAVLVILSGWLAFPLSASAVSGTWTIVPTPNNSATNNFLRGVSCVTPTDCWAVGDWVNSVPVRQTLSEHWDGTSWTFVAPANVDTSHTNSLTAVSCVATNDCWAVGFHFIGSTDQTLAEHWNGSAWSVVTTVDPDPGNNNELDAVMCTSGGNCLAVGTYIGTDAHNHTLAERWSGTSWSQVTSGNSSSTQNNTLLGVACVTALNCWAAGNFANGSTNQTLVEQYNGTQFSVVGSPNMGSGSNFLTAVACVSASDCSAVGNFVNGSSVKQTLAEHYNGATWSIVTSQNSSSSLQNILLGVVCVSSTDCWAVGGRAQPNPDPQDQTLIENWDGTSWTTFPSPSTMFFQANDLLAVTCTDASNCWAVGAFVNNTTSQNSGVDQTLALHFVGSTSPFVPDLPVPAVALALLGGASLVIATRRRPTA